jgi:DegV family protein with EDD domain
VPVSVVTDSSCDLPAELAAQHDITVVPLTVRFGEEELVDGQDLTTDEFWARCAQSSELPETAAPSPGAFQEAFLAAGAGGADAVVCINISSRLSATIQAAQAAARSVEQSVRVHVLDSRSVSLGLGMLALEAAQRASEGASAEDVVAFVEDAARRTRVVATLDTLENLKKGGRIGGAQALLGSLLSIKPVIEVQDGAVESGPRQRTRSRALRYLADKVASEPGIERLAVVHGAAPDLNQLLDMLASTVPRDNILVGDIGPVIGTHAGPRTIGVIYRVK